MLKINKPKITVIMATYNSEKFLRSCLDSIINQTFSNFIVKIIDDNSSDNTVSIIREYAKKDKRIKLIGINRTNLGLTKSLNKLINISDTEYIARMDADDISMPNRFEKQIKILENNKDISVVGTLAYEIDENEKIIKKRVFPITFLEIKKVIGLKNPILHPSVMMKTKDVKEIGGYDERFRFVQDYDLWFRLISNGKIIININEPLMKYRVISTHVNKRNLAYRIIDAKIRWNGLKRLKYGLFSRVFYCSIPIILGVIPKPLKKYLIRYSHRSFK